jgi:hypothetical protein
MLKLIERKILIHTKNKIVLNAPGLIINYLVILLFASAAAATFSPLLAFDNSCEITSGVLRAASKSLYSESKVPADESAEFYPASDYFDKIISHNAVGTPLFVSARPGGSAKNALKRDYFILRAFNEGGGMSVELSAHAAAEVSELEAFRSLTFDTLEIYFYRNAGEKLKKSGVALEIPRTIKISGSGDYSIYYAADDSTNPYNDRGRIYAYIRNASRDNFRAKLYYLLDKFKDCGIEITPQRPPLNHRFISDAGSPQYLIIPEGADEILNAPLFYPSTFVMPRKTGFGDNGEAAVKLLCDIISQGFLSSSRARLYSGSGAPLKKWNVEAGNDDRVFLSYGPGITYSDPDSSIFIFSPDILFLNDIEFADRDTFFFKARVNKRDALSESWYSSFNENPPLMNEKIKSAIIGFNRGNNLETAAGRLEYIKNIDDFWLAEGLFKAPQIACALYEKYNNEVKVADLVLIDRFAECLAAPAGLAEKIRDSLEKEYKIKYISGLPAADFILSAFDMKDYRPDGVKTDMPLRFAYFEYILREARRPEFLALIEARRAADLYSYLRILHGASAELKAIAESAELKASRNLRRKLKKLNPASPLYGAYLKQYRWWLDPPADKAAAALEISPIGAARLGKIVSESSAALEKVSGAAAGCKVKPRYAAREDGARYFIFKDGELVIDYTFLSMIYYKCGLDGVYHILCHELAADLHPGLDAFVLTGKALAVLNKKPSYSKLFDALELSGERRGFITARHKLDLR